MLRDMDRDPIDGLEVPSVGDVVVVMTEDMDIVGDNNVAFPDFAGKEVTEAAAIAGADAVADCVADLAWLSE